VPDLDTPITTTEALQDAINSALPDRLARERAKFSDYDELKTFKAEAAAALADAKVKLDTMQATNDTLTGTLSQKEKDAEHDKAVAKVAAEKKVPAKWISGDTPEAMAASADEWLTDAKVAAKPAGYVASQGTGDPGAQSSPYEAGRERAEARYHKKN